MTSDGIESVTLSGGGQSVTLDGGSAERIQAATANLLGTVELRRRERQQQADAQAGPTFQPPVRELVINAHPDAVVRVDDFKLVERPGGFAVPLPMAEAFVPRQLAEGLIERIEGYGPLAELSIGYLWTPRLGKSGGEERLWKWLKPTPLVEWALGHILVPRHVDVFLALNSRVATRAQMTYWQTQALTHTALDCLRVRDGKPQILPATVHTTAKIVARYGDWNDALTMVARALHQAQAGQLSLFGGDEDEDEEGEGDGDEG